jgi:hypothetical protein
MLIHEVIADVDIERSELVLVVHWHGGRHTELRVPKRRIGQHGRCASPEVEDIIRRMAERWPSDEIAATLNRMKCRTGTGLTWNACRVDGVRKRLGLTSAGGAPTNPKTMSLEEARVHLGVSNTVVLRLILSRPAYLAR